MKISRSTLIGYTFVAGAALYTMTLARRASRKHAPAATFMVDPNLSSQSSQRFNARTFGRIGRSLECCCPKHSDVLAYQRNPYSARGHNTSDARLATNRCGANNTVRTVAQTTTESVSEGLSVNVFLGPVHMHDVQESHVRVKVPSDEDIQARSPAVLHDSPVAIDLVGHRPQRARRLKRIIGFIGSTATLLGGNVLAVPILASLHSLGISGF